MSGCFSSNLCPTGFCHRSQGIGMKMKMPTKMYVWINTNETKNIRVSTVDVYSNKTQHFEKHAFGDLMDREKEHKNFIHK